MTMSSPSSRSRATSRRFLFFFGRDHILFLVRFVATSIAVFVWVPMHPGTALEAEANFGPMTLNLTSA